MFRSLFEYINLYAIDLNTNESFKEKEYVDYDFKIIKNISEIHKLQLHIYERGEKYKQVISDRFKSGIFFCFCFIEKSSGKAAYARWLRKGSFFHIRYKMEIELKTDEAFTMDSYTPIEFRGKGLHKEMNKRMLNYSKQELNINKVFLVILRGSEYAHLHKTVQELGYKRIRSHFYFNTGLLKKFVNKIKKTNV
jgi:hypothetical protein